MAVEVAELVGGALGGAIVSSVLSPLIAQRHERRDLRAAVLRGVARVEQTRWQPSAEYKEFRDAAVGLRAAALVASANRDAIERYVFLTQVARRASETDYEQNPDPEWGGGIDGTLADLVREAAEIVVDHVWHPFRKRSAVHRRLTANREAEEQLRAAEKNVAPGQRLDWDPVRF